MTSKGRKEKGTGSGRRGADRASHEVASGWPFSGTGGGGEGSIGSSEVGDGGDPLSGSARDGGADRGRHGRFWRVTGSDRNTPRFSSAAAALHRRRRRRGSSVSSLPRSSSYYSFSTSGSGTLTDCYRRKSSNCSFSRLRGNSARCFQTCDFGGTFSGPHLTSISGWMK